MRRNTFVVAAMVILLPLCACEQQQTSDATPITQKAHASTPKSEAKQSSKSAIKDFDTACEDLKRAAQVTKGTVSPAEDGVGAMFGCILGEAQTAKLFVTAKPDSSQVETVKVMWNDYFSRR